MESRETVWIFEESTTAEALEAAGIELSEPARGCVRVALYVFVLEDEVRSTYSVDAQRGTDLWEPIAAELTGDADSANQARIRMLLGVSEECEEAFVARAKLVAFAQSLDGRLT